jgi:hypothetical protein
MALRHLTASVSHIGIQCKPDEKKIFDLASLRSDWTAQADRRPVRTGPDGGSMALESRSEPRSSGESQWRSAQARESQGAAAQDVVL